MNLPHSLFLALAIIVSPSVTYAADALDYYSDVTAGTIWRRCDLGAKYFVDTKKCVGEIVKVNWIDAISLIHELNSANFEGFSDWRLPTGDDLKSLLLNNPRINNGDRKAPAYLGAASSIGSGYAIEADQQKCTAANELVDRVFGSVNEKGNDYHTSHRWLADNTDRKTFQSPLSVNYISSFGMHNVGRCNVLITAFLEDQFDAKRPGTLRPHALLPIALVRGGNNNQKMWELAKNATSNREQIIGQSSRDGRAQVEYLAGLGNKLVNGVKNVLAEANSNVSSSVSASSDGGRTKAAGVASIRSESYDNAGRKTEGYWIECQGGGKTRVYRSAWDSSKDWFSPNGLGTANFTAKENVSINDVAQKICK